MYTTHRTCRACGLGAPAIPTLKVSTASGPGEEHQSLIPVFDLGIQPLANDFTKDGQEQGGDAPLKVLYCPRCFLGQLSVVVRADIMYRNYSYVTSPSKMMQEHFDHIANDMWEEVSGFHGKTLLEIGSNDGGLLADFRKRGFYRVMGIDPAENLCRISQQRGIETICGFFCDDSAEKIAEEMYPDVILARHVFCHVSDWKCFIRGLETLAKENTLMAIEVPYVDDLLTRGEFDTVYHEHLSFMTITAMDRLLDGSQLKLSRIIRYPIHGGAVVIMLRHVTSPTPKHASVDEFLEAEKTSMSLERWKEFSLKVNDQISTLRMYVHGLVAQNKRVAALGASAKSTVWINACGFTRKEIEFIADETPQKQWKTSPGSGIPIVDEGAILRELPDYVIVFAWNFRGEILSKNTLAREKGVKFIVPVPTIETI